MHGLIEGWKTWGDSGSGFKSKGRESGVLEWLGVCFPMMGVVDGLGGGGGVTRERREIKRE